MGIWDRLFVSRVEVLLTQQLAEEKQRNLNDICRLKSDCDGQINFLHERYQDEVKYLRDRVKTVEEELERTRLLLHPNLNAISTRAEIAAAEESDKNREPEEPVLPPFVVMANRLRAADMEARLKAKADFDARRQKEAEQKDKEAQPQSAA